MKITINTESKVPAYQQMSNQIAAAMEAGEYKRGDRLPSEAEFCCQAGLAKGTVRKAFDRLEAEGYIKRLHGSGTYVLDWRKEYRQMALFEDRCRRKGLESDEIFRLLKDACNRRFTGSAAKRAAIIDCTPEIAEDIARILGQHWNLETEFYEVDKVQSQSRIPKENIWVTTKAHYEEVLPAAEKAGKNLLKVKIRESQNLRTQIASLDEDCLLGIVYDSQDFLMHISHTLALSGLHNTYYLCQKEEWNDKKKAIRSDDITWLISAKEQEIIRQMKEQNNRFVVYSYEIDGESLEEIKAFMEQKE